MRCPGCGSELSVSDLKSRKCFKCGYVLPVSSPGTNLNSVLPAFEKARLSANKKNSFPPVHQKRPHIPPPSRKSIFQPDDAMKGEDEFKSGEVVSVEVPVFPNVKYSKKIETAPETMAEHLNMPVPPPPQQKPARIYRAEKTMKVDINSIRPPKSKQDSFWADILLVFGIITSVLFLTTLIIFMLK